MCGSRGERGTKDIEGYGCGEEGYLLITARETVMRVTPANAAAAEIIAYTPGTIHSVGALP